MGGARERLVGAAKGALEGLELPRTLSVETLRRLLVSAEWLVNSRPRTEVPVDPEEEKCLTPNHLLLSSSSGARRAGIRGRDDLGAALTEWQSVLGSGGRPSTCLPSPSLKVAKPPGSAACRRSGTDVRRRLPPRMGLLNLNRATLQLGQSQDRTCSLSMLPEPDSIDHLIDFG